jgi:amidase
MDAWEDATTQAARVRAGEVSPAELVGAAIHRIEALNPQLNAVIQERFEQALEEARGPLPAGPFQGVPLLLKDLYTPSKGDPRCEGMRVLKEAGIVADHDSAVVRRFREAGFVIVGKTNTPELGTSVTTEPVAFGPSRNPWDPSRSTGGSSGGSAAAVASGMVAVASASDGGGSIRIPASECGLVGLKPNRARISRAPDRGEGWMGGSTFGVVSRTVRDTAAVLDLLAGPEVGDPYAAPLLPRPLVEELGVPTGRLRVGVLDHPPVGGVIADPEVCEGVRAVARLLESLGHDVHDDAHPRALEDEGFGERFLKVVAAGTASGVADWSRALGRQIGDDELEPGNAAFAALGRSMTAADYVDTVNWLHGWSRRAAAWWAEGWDLLVCPVLNGTPPPLGWLTDLDHGSERAQQLLQYTAQYNMTGQPALSLPLHESREGTPVGVQLVAAWGREDLLVRIASQIEEATPWAERRPGIGA